MIELLSGEEGKIIYPNPFHRQNGLKSLLEEGQKATHETVALILH